MFQLPKKLTQIFSSSTMTVKLSNFFEDYLQMDAETSNTLKLAYMGMIISIFWLWFMVNKPFQLFTSMRMVTSILFKLLKVMQ